MLFEAEITAVKNYEYWFGSELKWVTFYDLWPTWPITQLTRDPRDPW